MAQQSIRFQCPACGSALSVPANLAGVRGPCPQCRQEITAPHPGVGEGEPDSGAGSGSGSGTEGQRAMTIPPAEAAASEGIARKRGNTGPEESPSPPRKTFPPPPSGVSDDEPTRRTKLPPARTGDPPAAAPAPAPGKPSQAEFPKPDMPNRATSDVGSLLRDPAGRRRSRVLPAAAAVVVLAAAAAGAVHFFGSRSPVVTTDETPAAAEPPRAPAISDSNAATAPEDAIPDAAQVADPDPTSMPSPAVGADDSGPPPDPGVEVAESATAGGVLPGSDAADLLPDAGSAPDAGSPVESASTDEEGVLAAPRAALTAFLGAADWKERSKYVQLPERTLPLMERYYESRDDGPVPVTSITFQNSERVPNQPFMFYLFLVTTRSVPEGFPVSVEETSDGFKIDWEAFVEFGDQLLHDFLTNHREGRERFHVILSRSHFFGSEVPSVDKKHAFRIEPPIPGFHGYAFVAKDSALARDKLAPYLDWSAVSYPIVELQWVEEEGQRYVRLVDIVQGNWRADNQSAAESESAGAGS